MQIQRVPKILKFRPIKSKMNSPLKIIKLFQVLKFRLSHSFQSLLFAAETVEIKIHVPVVYAMHDGQDLKHPLVPIQLTCTLKKH